MDITTRLLFTRLFFFMYRVRQQLANMYLIRASNIVTEAQNQVYVREVLTHPVCTMGEAR